MGCALPLSRRCAHVQNLPVGHAANTRLADVTVQTDTRTQTQTWIGRVEVKTWRQQAGSPERGWGPACASGFNAAAAAVLCRELGLPNPGGAARAAPLVDSQPGPGTSSWQLQSIACRGSEARLADCTGDTWGNTQCAGGQTVNISCSGPMREWRLLLLPVLEALPASLRQMPCN